MRPIVVVTGASGFIGSAVLEAARGGGADAIALTRGIVKLPSSGVDWRTINFSNHAALVSTFRGVDAVVHAAGLAHVFRGVASAETFHEANVRVTAAVAAAATEAGVPRLVHVSSVSVYGSPSGGGTEDTLCAPSSDYASSKLEAEQEAARLSAGSGVRLTVLRLATVYGEGDRGNIARLIRSIDRGRFFWIGRGANRKSLIYRSDAARAILKVALGETAATGVFNVSATTVSMRQIVGVIQRELGRAERTWHVPASAARLVARGGALAGQRGLSATVERWLADDVYPAERFRAAFRFEPEVDLETGLRREVSWYRTREVQL